MSTAIRGVFVAMNPIAPILDKHSVVILDGALATELERRGADLRDPLWSAKLLVENPDLIRQVHYDYFLAGADVATTASYQATIPGLMARGLDRAQAADLLRLSVRLAQQARDDFWRSAPSPPAPLPQGERGEQLAVFSLQTRSRSRIVPEYRLSFTKEISMRRLIAILFLALLVMPASAQEPKKRLLLVTESRGFVHGVVNRGKSDTCLVERTFIDLAKKHPFFEVEYTQDSRATITGDNLKKFDAVFFYTTGELPLSDAQKSDLLAFVKNGKGFGGSHCATDTFYKWKEYGELIGAYFDGHPWNAGTKIKVIVEDKNHPATKHLGDSFVITDEIYQFRSPYDRSKLHVLMRLDMDSVKNQGKRADKDNALAWTREYGKGRVFYTALGHQNEVWADPRFQQHVIGGLRYMFGLEK